MSEALACRVMQACLKGIMGKYREIVREQGWRILAGAPCFAAGGFFFYTSGDFGVLFSLPFLLCGALIVAPLLATIFAEPFRSLFYPVGRFDRPLPLYSVQEAKRTKGLYEEAIAGLEKIAGDYPGELKPYTEMIDIAVVNLRDENRARSFLHRGLAELKKDDDKVMLKRFYEATITRLCPKPEWLETQQQRTLTAPDLKNQGPVEEPDGRLRRRFHSGGDEPESDFADPRRKIHYSKKKPA